MTQTLQNWHKVKLGDVAEIESGGTPSSTKPEYWDGDICWATLPDLKNKYIYDTERKITKLGLKNSSAKLLPVNSVIFSSRATIGEVAIAKVETSTNQGSKNFICNADKLYYEFLYYLLKSKVEEIKNLASGATYKEINKTVFLGVQVIIPDLHTQKHIAGTLAIYDDLIENNDRRIQILEQMVQAIYTEWFNHGKKMSKDWKIIKLRDCLKYYVGGGWGNETISDGFPSPAYVIRGTDIPKIASGNISECPLRFHKKSNFSSRRAEALDIVFEVSGGSKGQPVGRQFLVTGGLLNQFDEPVIFASFCKLVRVNQEIVSPYQITLLFNDLYRSGKIMKYQTQSTGITNFKFEQFIDDVDVAVPTRTDSARFVEVCEPIFNEIQKIGAINNNLIKQRDLLLPKLVTGEIKI